MPRNLRFALAILAASVLIGMLSLRGLYQHIENMAETQTSEEEARREVLAPPISTPTDVTVAAKIFWASGIDSVAPAEVELPLSADPLQRARQVLQALVSQVPTAAQRTIPAGTTLLGFYVLSDGTAVADFSEALAAEMPSGILSEKMAVDSIRQTLASNVPSLSRLKILIHGQEVETLAGHLDLTGYFDLSVPPAPQASPPTPAVPSANSTKSTGTPSK
jgi:sporulation and spore germination protein